MIDWKTIDNGISVDVVPVNDDREHGLGDECWCQPVVEKTDGVPLITHNEHTHTWGEWNDSTTVKVGHETKIISMSFCSECEKIQSRIGTLK